MSENQKTKVLLYSSGMDSWLISKLWKPDVKLFIRIHTPNNEAEYQRVKDDPTVSVLECDLHKYEIPEANYFLPLRNLIFVTLASYYGDVICLGATGSSTHFDKNMTFANKAEDVINYLLSESDLVNFKDVEIVMPYKDHTKKQLLEMYLEQGGSLEEAYENTCSCYTPVNNEPCGYCISCLSKFVAFYRLGYKFSEERVNNFISYVGDNYGKCKPNVQELYDELQGNDKE